MSDKLGYASAASSYWQAGWKGVLPLPHAKKVPPPKDTTGYDGLYPSWPDIMAWAEDNPAGNIALRLPNSVVGIDVDHYGDKLGGDTLAHAESLWGPLPPTVRSTSRIDGKSGIRLYRVEPGTELETLVQFPELRLGGIEVVQFFHRYCIVWPSIHDKTERRYQWLDSDGNITSNIPRPGTLPLLPAKWVEGLRRRANATITATADVNAALAQLPAGNPSPKVAAELAKAKTTLLSNPGTRHDTTLKSVLRLIRLGEQGESGIQQALHSLEEEFVKVVTADGSRDVEGARLEYRRMAAGQRGHDLIASTPTQLTAHQLVGIEKIRTEVTEVAPNVVDELHEWRAAQPTLVQEIGDGFTFSPDPDRFLFDDTPYALGALETFPLPSNPLFSASLDDVDAFLMGEQAWEREWGQLHEELDEFDRLLFADEHQEVGTTTVSKTSWGPVDLEAVLSDDLTPEEPVVLRRGDGKSLLYRGRVNSLVGEPESGKSWVALLACVQAMTDGENVLFLDFEDTAASVVMRLLALGVTPAVLRRHFSYAEPDTALDSDAQEDLTRTLDTTMPTVVVVDGVNAAMTLMGMDLQSNVDATRFFQMVLKPLTRIDSAVITVDHVTKSAEGRGTYAIGAQAKKAMTNGAMIGVRAVEQFGRGRLGKLELTVLKDKAGGLRAIAESRGRGPDYLASVTIDARDQDRIMTDIYFESKEQQSADGISKSEKALIIKMIQVSQYLEATDPDRKGLSLNNITENVAGRRVDLRGAVAQLIETHHVRVVDGPRSARLHVLTSPYRGPEHADLMELADAS